MNAVTTIEDRIAAKIDTSTTHSLAISDSAGGVAFANMAQVMEFAKMIAISGVAVPKHLRGNPGACLGVTIQAIEWRMSPYAVANKSYSVNDRLAYEAQLIHAVVLSRAPIEGRPKIEYLGEGAKRRCRVSVKLNDGTDQWVDYTSPEIGQIPTKNSPLWKSDPDQQLFYFSARSLARRHFPDVILGVYAKDEIEDHRVPDAQVRDVAPRTLSAKLDSLAAPRETTPPHDADTGEIVNQAADPAGSDEAAAEAGSSGEVSDADDGRFPPAEGDAIDPIADARQRGAEAKEAGLGTRAMPGEYRAEGREAEAEAWMAGHKGAQMAEAR
jgi:hypothetical protein